jgi:uncharacterized protein (TIGR02246 family)
MNRPSLVVAMVVVAVLPGCAAQTAVFSDSDKAAIRTSIEEFTAAMSKGDHAAAAALYAEDGVIMPPNAAAAEGRAEVQKALASMGRPQSFSQPVVDIEGEGTLAYARLDYDVTFTPPNATAPASDKGKVLIVMRKEADGTWRTIQGMFNSNLPAPR